MPELATAGRDYRFASGQGSGLSERLAGGGPLGGALKRAFGRGGWRGRSAQARPSADYARPSGTASGRSPAGPAQVGRFPAGLAAAVIAIVALGAATALLASIQVRDVSLSGAASLGEAEVRSWAGLDAGVSWLAADPEELAARLAENPRIASAEVRRGFPGTLEITVAERVPVAVVYARGDDGRVAAHCVDEAGTVFAPASGYPGANVLPVLSGLEIRGLRYGLRLDGPFLPVLSSLAALAVEEPALVAAISELRLVSREGLPAELMIYPARHRVPVRTKPSFGASLLKSAMLVLDVVEGLSEPVSELDARTGAFVYRTKEAVSGR